MSNRRAMKISRWIQVLLVCSVSLPAAGAGETPHQWSAQWIAAADGPARDYDVVYFRKTLPLAAVPGKFMVDVSADTRFELHVNGRRVGAGPALADIQHWRCETYDLAPFLKSGENTIAAIVWNFGTSAPIAQFSSQTAFLISAEDESQAAINTGEGWQASHERGRTVGAAKMRDYYAAGPEETMDGWSMNWNWDGAETEITGKWQPARALGHAAPRGAQDSPTRWILEKNQLPPMQYMAISAGHVVRATGMKGDGADLGKGQIQVPANSTVSLLFDREALTTAFPSLHVEGGKDAKIDLTYAEALYDAKGEKGKRNEVAGRHIEGVKDHIISDGGDRTYRTLWWRAWRYIQIDVKTADAPLTIDSLGGFYTAYPFSAVGHFESDDAELGKIWDVGWRTAQLCAHETYMDTPYWEQMQYVGDTRIQAVISYGVTGDDRLARQAMKAYRDSQLTDGLTQSRYPSSLTQVIPPFSLLWVGMIHDFWMYRDDPAFAASLLPGTRGVLDWFAARQRADGLLGKIEWWPFVDWNPQAFPGGVPPQEIDGGSSALTLQYVEALQDAAELEDHLGEKDRAADYRAKEKRAVDGLLSLSWNEAKGLLADTPSQKTYSQQANSLAVLLDVIPKEKERAVMSRVIANPGESGTGIAQASYYFRYYVARAMVHAGLGDEYIAQLQPWREMLRLGLSTWAETSEPTRSDSHAWSAHPTLDLLAIVGGIGPGSPGFESVRIEPHLGKLNRASATMPTPKGLVEVQYKREDGGWSASIHLPPGMPGKLIWHGETKTLHAGSQTLSLKE